MGKQALGVQAYLNLSITIAGMMFSAASERDNNTRDLLVGQVHNYASSNINSTAFGAYYNAETGFVENNLYNRTGVNS